MCVNMVKAATQTFELIPSMQSRGDSPAPISLVPALPVRFKNASLSPQYGLIDTSAKISTIVSSLANELDARKHSTGSKIIVTTPGNLITVDVFKISLIICDKHFSSWLYLRNVPFAVLPDTEASSGQGKIVLGFDSCLSNLHLDINYPRKTLKVSASAHLLASESEATRPKMPSRIIEGENLINLGSYNAAITMIAAGIEEVVTSYLEIPSEGRRTLGELQSILAKEALSPRFKRDLEEIVNFRNMAVHGTVSESISRDDARKILKKAKSIINEVTNLERDRIGNIT